MSSHLKTTGAWVGNDRVTQHCWAQVDGNGTPHADTAYNVGSITDNATGNYTINFATNFAGGLFSATATSPSGYIAGCATFNVGSVTLRAGDSNWGVSDHSPISLSVTGN